MLDNLMLSTLGRLHEPEESWNPEHDFEAAVRIEKTCTRPGKRIQTTMENQHAIHGKTQLFLRPFSIFVCLPEGRFPPKKTRKR